MFTSFRFQLKVYCQSQASRAFPQEQMRRERGRENLFGVIEPSIAQCETVMKTGNRNRAC